MEPSQPDIDVLTSIAHVGVQVKKAKKKVDTVSLSFGDEIEEAEAASVGLRSVEEVTAQRLQVRGASYLAYLGVANATKDGRAVD